MLGFNDYMSNFFNRASQGAVPPSRPTVPGVGFAYNAPPAAAAATDTVGTVTPTFGKTGVFGDVKPGQSADVRGFTATRGVGGAPDVISGHGTALGMMDLLRGQGYTPDQASTAVTGAAAAELDATKNKLLPGSTAADIANTQAEARLRSAQATEVPLEGASVRSYRLKQGGLVDAQVGQTNAQTNELRSTTDALNRGVYVDAQGNTVQYDPTSGTFKTFKLKGLGMLPK